MKTPDPARKIIVALDVDEISRARALVEQLSGRVGAFKIGKQLFTRCGPAAVRMVHERGGRVFLDLKFHDIPATVALASREAARLGVFMFNVHAAGGSAMMRAAAEAARAAAVEFGCTAPVVLGVTVLTSLGEDDLRDLGIRTGVQETVVARARAATAAGLDGVVASPREIVPVKNACGGNFLVVTPGVRPAAAAIQDQKRVTTPAMALQSGADYLVIGRPVTAAPDPVAAVESIARELETAAHAP